MFKRWLVLSSTLAAMSLLAACSSNPFTGENQLSDTAIGAGTGAALGAGAGLAVGSISKANPGQSALIGAGVGAITGAGVGMYMDKQQAELSSDLKASGVSVTRVGNDVILHMASNVMFDSRDAQVKPRFQKMLNDVATVVARYPHTRIMIDGHADATDGDAAVEVSQKRADSVAEYLTGRRIDAKRMMVRGWGTSQPLAVDADQAANRAVEISLSPAG
jgi:outer membrane protein OmpA-like peptidoglycan-associated protein